MDDFKENLTKGLKKTGQAIKKVLLLPFKKFLIIAIIIAIFIIILAGLYDALLEEFSDKVSKHIVSNPVPVQYDTTDNSIVINDDTIKDLIEVMEQSGIPLEDLNLTEENLKKFYAAELVSSEINRGAVEEEGKYYGRVYIKRQNETTGELESLQYVPLEQFEAKNASDILNCFSIDGDQICFASVSNNGETIDIEKQEYKNLIAQYVMPTELLIDLCVITQNPNFVIALADKIIKETEIVIQIMQSKTIKETTTTITYDLEIKTSKTVKSYDVNGTLVSSIGPTQTTSTQSPGEGSPKVIEEEPVENINSTFRIVSVDSWFVKEIRTYNRVEKTETENIPGETIEDEIHSTNTSNIPKVHADGSKTITNQQIVKTKINQKKSAKIKTTTISYEEGITEEEIDEEEKIDEFIELLKTQYEIPGSSVSEAALGKLEDGAGIFFNMLKNGERTQSLEQIMRYILGKATGNDYGVTELDFSAFDIQEFNEVESNHLGLSTYLRQFANDGEARQSDDGKYYLLYSDGSNTQKGWPTIGNADLQWKSNYPEFERAGKVLIDGVETEVDNVATYVNEILGDVETLYTKPEMEELGIYIEKKLVDEIGDDKQKSKYNEVLNATRGLDLSKQQLYALTCIRYNFGHLPEKNGYTFKQVYEEGLQVAEAAGEGVNSWIHNKYIWDNWWVYLGYNTVYGPAPGLLKGRDAAFETYVKGTYNFELSDAKGVFDRKYYMFFTQEQLNMYPAAADDGIPAYRTAENEQEIFTYKESVGSIIEAAYYVAEHFLNYEVHYAGQSVYDASDGERGTPNEVYCCSTFQSAWVDPLNGKDGKRGIVCATFVSLAMWKAGTLDEDDIEYLEYQAGFNGCGHLTSFLDAHPEDWELIYDRRDVNNPVGEEEDLQPGDIVFNNRSKPCIYFCRTRLVY